MTRPLLLDLFCGAGGAAVGYHRAGFDVVGVDIAPQPHYPFEFHQLDALDVLARLTGQGKWRSLGDFPTFARFDVIHASPPCQRYSDLARRNGNGDDWPDLISPLRDLLCATGLPYVIENVEGAPLIDPITLCGTMFRGLRVIRHRLFESSHRLLATECPPHPRVFTYDKRKAHYGKLDQNTSFVQVTGGGNATLANKLDAMGIDWMKSHAEVNEAIPPAYTELVGRQLLARMELAA